jgi:hypothetical protein
MRKHLQIATLSRAAAVRLRSSKLRQRFAARTRFEFLNLSQIVLDHVICLFLCASDIGLPPASWASTFAVLYEKMSNPDLVPRMCKVGRRDAFGAMMLRHVFFELLGIGTRGRFPSRVLGLGVEVVGEVLRVGAADLPALGQPSFLRRLCAVSCDSVHETRCGAYHCG